MKDYTRSEGEQKQLEELNNQGEAARFDEGKERYDLVSMISLKDLALHYGHVFLTNLGLGGFYNAALYYAREFWMNADQPVDIDGFSPIIWSARCFFELMDRDGSFERPPHLEIKKPGFIGPRYDLVPPGPLNEVAMVYTYGTIKYNDNNWRLGMKWGKCYGPLERHAKKWRMGEIYDDESGLHHLAHSVWQCFALYEYQIWHKEKDDRYRFQPQS